MTFLIIGYNSIESVAQLITVILIFIFVLALTYFVTRWFGNYQKNAMSDSNIKVLETMKLSNSKYIQIVKIGKKCFSIAVCKDTVTYLSEIDEDDLVYKKSEDVSKLSVGNFKDVFEKYRNKTLKK